MELVIIARFHFLHEIFLVEDDREGGLRLAELVLDGLRPVEPELAPPQPGEEPS